MRPSRVRGTLHRLRKEVKEAHGIIVGTPEYHGSLSGVLKNALDLMSFDEIEGKMMGLVVLVMILVLVIVSSVLLSLSLLVLSTVPTSTSL